MKTTFRRSLACLLGATTLGLTAVSTSAGAVDLGDASVMSQQGQKLKIAIPYGSAPGERVSVNRFVIKSVALPDGYPAVRADSFTLSKGERHNVVFVQSAEPISAPGLKIVLAVQDGESTPVGYDLTLPPGKAAVAMPGEASLVKVSTKRGSRATASGASGKSADGTLSVDEAAALLVPGGRDWR